MRSLLAFSAGIALFLASGCAPRAAERPQKIDPVRPSTARSAPSRSPGASQPAPAGGGLMSGGAFEEFPVPFRYYQDQGLPVEVPAYVGAVPFGLVGFVIGLPAMLVYAPFARGLTWEIPLFTGVVMAEAGYVWVGAPFWLVKQVVWDGPCAFGRFLNLHLRCPQGRVDYLARRIEKLVGWKAKHPDASYAVGRKMDRRIEEAGGRLEQLTAHRPQSAADWPAWWKAHRGEFDRSMKRIEPAPEAAPAPEAVPAPAPAT